MDAIEEFIHKTIAEQEVRAVKPAQSTQADKNALGMAGEFYVAAELLRRGIHASVTYGNAKSADILAMDLERSRYVRIEVKTTRDKGSVLVGSGRKASLLALPDSQDLFWVLCLMPTSKDERSHPSFFILPSAELKALAVQEWTAYEARRGMPFEKQGMWTIPLSALKASGGEGAWHRIKERLET